MGSTNGDIEMQGIYRTHETIYIKAKNSEDVLVPSSYFSSLLIINT